MLKAITRSARQVDARVATINAERTNDNKPPITIAQFFDYHATDKDVEVTVTEQDFMEAKNELVPSVSAEEIGHYERVRQEFEGSKDKDKGTPQSTQQAMKSAPNNRLAPAANGTRTAEVPPSNNASASDMEAWQARQIEEIMSRSFADGSLARNNPREAGYGKGKGKGKGHDVDVNGHSRHDEEIGSNTIPSNREGQDSATRNGHGNEDDDDEMVIKTGQLSMTTNGAMDAKGKGKAMALDTVGSGRNGIEEFGDAAGDEGLYD